MAREEDKEVEFGQTAQSPFHLLAQGRLALPPPNKPSRTLRPLPTLGRSSPHHLRRSAGSDTNVMGRTLVRTSKSSQTHFLVDLSGNCSCVLFGIVSVVLGVFQVWISWCSWGGNETRACRIGKIASDKAGSQPTGVEISNETTGTVAARSVFTWVA